MGLLKGRVTGGEYRPALLHRWLKPAISGNTINGLGETQPRRPTPIYHWFIYKPTYPFKWVERIFITNNARSWRGQKLIMEAMRYLKQPPAPVAPEPVHKSPEEWSAAIKEYAVQSGAHVVGITRMRPEWVFEGHEIPEKWVIMLGTGVDFETFRKVPEREGGLETLRKYNQGHRAAMRLADWLREQGWPARGYGAPFASPLNMIPAALEAGIGELGKHGSIINRKLGSAFRLAAVFTDLPLVEDRPDTFGADEFCMRCQACTRACPPDAIYSEKQLVRGVTKWYVDFDKCIPYFNDTLGCGICLAVCPWSRPGVPENLIAKMARRRVGQAEAA